MREDLDVHLEESLIPLAYLAMLLAIRSERLMVAFLFLAGSKGSPISAFDFLKRL